jgi:hypothetical protein
MSYEQWREQNLAAGGGGYRHVYDNWIAMKQHEADVAAGKAPNVLGQTGGGTAEQQATGAKAAGSFADDHSDAGNANTGDPYIDELRSGRVAGAEDMRRFSNAQLKQWEHLYVGGGKFKNKYGDIVGKPIDSGPNTPKGFDGLGGKIEGFGGGRGVQAGGGYTGQGQVAPPQAPINPLFDPQNPLQNQLVALFQQGGMFGQDEGNLGRSLMGGGLWWADKDQPGAPVPGQAPAPPPGTPGGQPSVGQPKPQQMATPQVKPAMMQQASAALAPKMNPLVSNLNSFLGGRDRNRRPLMR